MGKQSLEKHIPYLRYKSLTSQTWSTAGNTHTVTDADVFENSIILIMHTSAYMGRWHITVSDGSFLITSSDSEATTVTFDYLIL